MKFSVRERQTLRRRERMKIVPVRGGKEGWEESVIRGVRDNSKIKD